MKESPTPKRQRFSTIYSPLSFGTQAPGTEVSVDTNANPPSVKEELVRELLQELDSYKLISPDNRGMLRKLATVIEKPLAMVFEKLWRSRDVPEDWKKAIVTSVYKRV